MSTGKSWQEFLYEFEQIEHSGEYRPFRPILTRTRALIGRADATGDENDRMDARALLTLVKHLLARQTAGDNVQVLVDQITGGYVQADWIVEGDVRQANRDFIDRSTKTVINFVGASAAEMNLAANSPHISVPIVPVVMTRDEAEQLVAGTAFQGDLQVLENAFSHLNDHLRTACQDWLGRYGETPTAWRPFGSSADDPTIDQLMRDAFYGLEEDIKGIDRPLVPSFRDIRTLIEGDNRGDLRRMRDTGCIVVLDVISIRHPKLQRAFHQSLLDAYPKTSIVSIAPSLASYEIASRLAVLVQLKVEEMEFLQRMQDPGDYGASEQIFERQKLKPWLSTRVQKLDLSIAPRRRGVPRMI